MIRKFIPIFCFAILLVSLGFNPFDDMHRLAADENALPATDEAADEDTLRSATARGLVMVKDAATRWQENTNCFSCHHQTLPMLAQIETERAGFAIDDGWMQSQADTAHEYFQDRIKEMNEGKHVPGGSGTTAYGLWALSIARRPSDATTTAMVSYLLQIQGVQRIVSAKSQPGDGRWIASCQRPPIQGSQIGDTTLVLIGLHHYATADQQPQLAAARVLADKFIADAKIKNHQDRLWRFWGLHQLAGDSNAQQMAMNAILNAQRPDGGWSQKDDDLSSDAYSTGQTLFMLCKSGLSKADPAAQRAREYLMKTQLGDGSWLVESRVKNKAQPYFENGDPHGEHQFLSTAATCWATAALAQCLQPQ